jgi:DNA-binding SARP family transcriptional activator
MVGVTVLDAAASRGEQLRELRTRAGLTQPALADLAQISVRALREIEQGRVTRPHPGSLERLARALSLSGGDHTRLTGTAPAQHAVSIGILGPLQLLRSGTAIALNSPSQQRILALLALEADRPVAAEEIASVLWAGPLPDGWRGRLHVHLNQIRQILAPGRTAGDAEGHVRREGSGYQLCLSEGQLDAALFLSLSEQAAALSDPRQQTTKYLQALGCWRGGVLSGDDGLLSARPAAQALNRARLAATLALADAAAESASHDRALIWLQAVASEEPLHEGVHSRLMIALAATGQQDKALRLYRELSRRLADDLGVDPAAQTQVVYRKLLDQGTIRVASASSVSRAAQLPMANAHFAGRDDALNTLTAHFTGATRPGQIPAPRILVVHGMPGVGKTSLALHLAHRIKKLYPDGQLFADLQGEREIGVRPGQVLSAMLRALGLPPYDIPAETSERSAALRSLLAGKRVLMMLDDAKSASQVLPLLPSDDGNDVLITSRSPLAELPVTRYRLEPLTLDGSLSVLSTLLPNDTAREPSAASEIAANCAGLPLALRVAAARVHTGVTLTDVAHVLSDEQQRVSELRSGQLAVHSSLESSYVGLSPQAQRLLRRLASLASPVFPQWAVRTVTGVPQAEAIRLLAELTNAHLVTAAGPHFAFHDLVRLFGREKATEEDLGGTRALALQYFSLAQEQSTHISVRKLPTAPLQIAAPPALPNVDIDDAVGWFDRSLPILSDLTHACASDGDTPLAAGLLNEIAPFLITRNRIDELEALTESVTRHAEQRGDMHSVAYALCASAQAHVHKMMLEPAIPLMEQALDLFAAAGNVYGQCHVNFHRQYLKRRTGDIAGALEIAAGIIEDYRKIGDKPGESSGHQALGMIHREYTKDLQASRHHFEEALRLVSDRPSSKEYAVNAYGLAFVYSKLGLNDEAEALLTTSLATMRGIGDRLGIITSLNRLSDLWPAEKAKEALTEAFALAEEVGQSEVIAHVHQAYCRHFERNGDLGAAIEHAEAAGVIYRKINVVHNIAEMDETVKRLKAAAQMASR